ncbi:hypothetical protein BGZ74_009429 [Mortierella antarctica]|nr:hypothetical protein BGZ74_009429 [Mortierella antarctica]
MDRNTVHLYETLGVPKSSTQDEIKKAYRRLALRYHPDKVNVAEVPDHETRFRDIQAAYEVLGDPKKRQVYDKYGLMGVQMAGTEIGARLVELESLLCALFIVFSALFVLAIIFLSFLSVRVDGKVDWNYFIVFIPLWILDAILGLMILYQFGRPVEVDDEDPHDRDADAEGETSAAGSSAADRDAQKQQKIREKKQQRVVGSSFAMVNLFLFVAFQVLIVRKANDFYSISSPEVFAPYFALEGIFLILALVRIAMALKVVEAEVPVTAKLRVIFEALWWKVVRLALAVLIMLRVDDYITCSWGIVFIPLYLVGLKYLVQLLLGYRSFSKMQNPEMRQQGKALMVTGLVIFVIIGSLSYSLIGLLAAKLDGYDYSASRVLIPVFIVLAIMLCCSGCCLPCLLLASGAGEDGMVGPEGAEIRMVSPNLRIEGAEDGGSGRPSPSGSRIFGRSPNNRS